MCQVLHAKALTNNTYNQLILTVPILWIKYMEELIKVPGRLSNSANSKARK